MPPEDGSFGLLLSSLIEIVSKKYFNDFVRVKGDIEDIIEMIGNGPGHEIKTSAFSSQ